MRFFSSTEQTCTMHAYRRRGAPAVNDSNEGDGQCCYGDACATTLIKRALNVNCGLLFIRVIGGFLLSNLLHAVLSVAARCFASSFSKTILFFETAIQHINLVQRRQRHVPCKLARLDTLDDTRRKTRRSQGLFGASLRYSIDRSIDRSMDR